MKYKSKEEYILEHCTPEDQVLAGLNRETHMKMLNPTMLSGHYQGKILEMISYMIRPEKILEIGTFTGYSAICMARGLAKGGVLHTIERNDEIVEFAQQFIKRAGMDKKIMLHTGHAQDIIPRLTGPFDLVFIDADKSEYIDYYTMVMPKTISGGFIVADNVLWDNKVYKPEYKNDENTSHIKEFNAFVMNDQSVENFILPVRDGLMIVRKK